MGIINSSGVVKSPTGKSRIQFWTSVEVETEADVKVDIAVEDIIDDIIDSMDELQAEELVKKAGLLNKSIYEGENLKRHLCDLAEVSYASNHDEIFQNLINKL